MFKDIQVTLYDIFGYLLPGALSLASIIVFFWTVFEPWKPLRVPMTPSAFALVCLIFLAYLVGHLGQAVGNLLEKTKSARKILEDEVPLSEELEAMVRDAVGSHFNPKAKMLSPEELYRLCDESLVHHQSMGEREIFTYREGFYRGNCVALTFLAAALLLRTFHVPAKILVADCMMEVGMGVLILTAALSATGAFLAFQRYKRFARHRIRSSLLRFLAMNPKRASGEVRRSNGQT